MSAAKRAPRPSRREVKLFIMDVPNVDMDVGWLLKRKPTAADRPDMKQLLEWLMSRVKSYQELDARLFVNRAVEPRHAARQRTWVRIMRQTGYVVRSRPRHLPGGDVDDEMVTQIRWYARREYLTEVIVASNDANCFYDLLMELAQAGIIVTILGFERKPSRLTKEPLFNFVPWPSIPGVLPGAQETTHAPEQ